MHGDDDFRGELLGRLGGGALTLDSLRLRFQKGYDLLKQGNVESAKAEFSQIIDGIGQLSQKYEGEKQFRRAAEVNFYLAIIQEAFGNEEEAKKILEIVTDQLLAAGKLYHSMSEIGRAVAPYSLAILTQIIVGSIEKAKQIYQEVLNSIDESFVNERETLYGPGYLIAAIEQVNQTNYLQAQDLINSRLVPQLKTADMKGFIPIIDKSFNAAYSLIEQNTKLPRIEVSISSPGQVLYNETFEIQVIFINKGEGEARDFKATINIPENLELIEGQPTLEIPVFPPDASAEIKLKLRFLSNEEKEQVLFLSGNFEYTDMLGSKHSGMVSKVELLFVPFQKKQDLIKAIDEMNKRITTMADVGNKILDEEVVDSIKFLISRDLAKAKAAIEENDIDEADKIISTVKEFFHNFENKLFNPETLEKIKQRREEEINQRIKEHEEQIKTEYEQKIQQINEEYEKEKQEMQERFEKEKHDLETTLRIQYERELKNIEEELNEKHQQEIQKIKDESENAIREIQQKMNQLETELRDQLKEEYQARLEEEKQKLMMEHEREKQAMERAFSERLESELATQKANLEQEFQQRLDALERQYQEKIDQKVEAARIEERAKHSRELANIKEEYEDKIKTLTENYEKEITSLKAELEKYRRSPEALP